MDALNARPEGNDAGRAWFTTTHWTVVQAAGRADSPEAATALETLCRTYWYPLYAYIRRRGYNTEDAQDLTQAFFARLLDKQHLKDADRAKGKFRSFLLSSLNHFLADDWRRSHRQKRGDGEVPISLDAQTAEGRYQLEPASVETPEKIFARRWAWTLLNQSLTKLEQEFAAAAKQRQFEYLRTFLSSEADEGAYAAAAAQLEMSVGAVRVAVHRIRQRYRELVRAEIAHTVSSPSELEEEMNGLFAALD